MRRRKSPQGSAADRATVGNPFKVTGHAPGTALPPTTRNVHKKLAASYRNQTTRLSGARMGTPGVRKYSIRWFRSQ